MTSGPRTSAHRAAARWPGCWSPTSRGSWPAPTRRCCSPTSAPRWSRSRAPAATTPGPGSRRCATASRPTTSGVNRNKRSIALDLKDPDDAGRRAGAGPPRRRRAGELQARRPGPLRPRLRHRRRRATRGVVYASISGFGSGPRGAALPGYDLIVQAISGLMSLTGDPDGEPYRAGISVFDVMAGLHATIGVLAALNHRHETGRGQHVEVNLLSSALSGLVNQSSAYVAGGVVPFRMGNSHPSLFPYEPLPCSDGDLIITAGNNGQFRKLVEVLGVPELADDPRFARNEDRTANRDELRPLLVERLRTRAPRWSGSATSSPPACPCGPINTIDGGVAFAEEIGLDPVVVGRRRARPRCPSVRNPITLLRDRRPTTGCPRRPWTSTAPRSAAGWPPAEEEHAVTDAVDGLRVPDLPRHLDRRRDPAAGPGPHRRPDGQGRVRRAGLLAGRDAPADARRRPGSSRRCWSRWPTTASPRRRSPRG